MAGPPVPRTALARENLLIAGAAAASAVLALAGARVLGVAGLLLPLAAVATVALLRFPAAAIFGTLALVVLVEGSEFGLAPGLAHVYDNLFKGITVPDVVLLLGVAGLALRLLRDESPVRLPPPVMTLTSVLVALAGLTGLVIGRGHGASLSAALIQGRPLAYLVVLPIVVVNLGLEGPRLTRVLAGIGALAVVKGVLGVAAVATGRGTAIAGGSSLTYYEPTANWLLLVVILTVVAGVLLRAGPPRWLLAATPLLLAALLLSLRRSFWIGLALGLAIVVLLGLSPTGRRLIVPIAVLLVAGVWSLGSVAVQSDTPLGQRVQSLSTSQIQSKPEDRYRFDERANVFAAISAQPLSGLGLAVPWQATARTLPVEVDVDHQYVHFAALYWWLKLGVLGLVAYAMAMIAGIAMSWQTWRRSPEPALQAVGLGSLCAFLAFVVIESTGTFTGVDPRLTPVLAAHLGLLAVLARRAASRRPAAP
jgi:O-antigen ligase